MRIRGKNRAAPGLGALLAVIVQLGLATLLPRTGFAQTAAALTPERDVQPEAFGSVGWGHLARAEDQTFGDEASLTAGAGVLFKRHLGVELEINRLFGLTAATSRCGLAACVGASREGFTSAMILSANVRYLFGSGNSRVQPFVVGGVGGMWTRAFVSEVIVQNGIGTLTESVRRDAGLAINAGGGLSIALHPMVSLRPEVRVYDSSVQSRQNLYLVRTSVGAAVRW